MLSPLPDIFGMSEMSFKEPSHDKTPDNFFQFGLGKFREFTGFSQVRLMIEMFDLGIQPCGS